MQSGSCSRASSTTALFLLPFTRLGSFSLVGVVEECSTLLQVRTVSFTGPPSRARHRQLDMMPRAPSPLPERIQPLVIPGLVRRHLRVVVRHADNLYKP